MTAARFAAVDLGASSGRVIVGTLDAGRLRLDEVRRFPNSPVELPDGLHWDVLRLHQDIVDGLREVARSTSDLAGIGIDTWGVDYGLVSGSGRTLGAPFCYRDGRSAAQVDRVHQVLPPQRLYPINGLQFLPFNTIYQLAAEDPAALRAAERMLLIPDLLAFWLTGRAVAERTNASTTGLLDARTGRWSGEVAAAVGVDPGLLPELTLPGTELGGLLPGVAGETGLAGSTPVYTVGSHDTASAVVGVPSTSDEFGYVSCGTWGLVGVELEAPVLTEQSRLANFTNEGGVDGTLRYLRNVMGLWVLQELQREWQRSGESAGVVQLVAEAAAVPAGGPQIDIDDPAFLPPGPMVHRVRDACLRAGRRLPDDRAQIVRCVIDSLAAAFAGGLRAAAELSGKTVRVLHLVGGGARNDLLCQLTADACGLPVVAGPVEATAAGNVLVQARAAGVLSGDLTALRRLLPGVEPTRTFQPRTRAQLGVAR